jgi:hypothetical protein
VSRPAIPDLKLRLGNTEEVREWNKMREAIISLARHPEDPPRIVRPPPLYGFQPRAFIDADGIGFHPGCLRFIRTSKFFTAAGTDKEAVEIYPKLGGTTIDTIPPPRVSKADGDWEAWAIYREDETAHAARIEINALGTGAGTLERDEKAARLCIFKVHKGTDLTPRVEITHQFVYGSLDVPIYEHQWRVVKTDDAKCIVRGGTILWPRGMSTPIVFTDEVVADSSEFTVTENGSFWLSVSCTDGQQAESVAVIGSQSVTLKMYRVETVTSAAITFRGASVNSPNPPAHGTGTTDEWNAAGFDIHWELAKVALESGDLQVTNQICTGPIWLPETTEGFLA